MKTTNGSARTPFFLSRNELEVSKGRQEDWRIYRVHLFATSPRIFTLAPPLDGVRNRRPELRRASLLSDIPARLIPDQELNACSVLWAPHRFFEDEFFGAHQRSTGIHIAVLCMRGRETCRS